MNKTANMHLHLHVSLVSSCTAMWASVNCTKIANSAFHGLKVPCSSPSIRVQVVGRYERTSEYRQSRQLFFQNPVRSYSFLCNPYTRLWCFLFQYSIYFKHSVLVHQLFCLYYLISWNICSAARPDCCARKGFQTDKTFSLVVIPD